MKRSLPRFTPPPMLDDMEKTISMSTLTKDAERIAKDIESRKTLYRVKRTGGSDIVVMDRDQYESWVATVEFLMQHPNWREELAEGDRQLANGECRLLEDVLQELGIEVPAPHAPRRAPARRAARGGKKPRRKNAGHAPRRSS
jgi:PHD/YefM family antitoxin component YafN of YafNO toxin-antitoxin module